MKIEIGKTYLITTDNYFVAPNGKQYRAVFGTAKGVHTAEDTLGIRPNGRNTNWYVHIGRMTIAGCQIHYSMQCDEVEGGSVNDWQHHEGKALISERPTYIYMAD